MVEPMTEAEQRLEELVRIAMQRAVGLLGWSNARVLENKPKLTSKDAQDHLFGAIENSVRVSGYFGTQRRILDVGCGTAAFVHSCLSRGHEAWGVDLDRDRLAIARAKLPVHGFPPEWESRAFCCDASQTPFEANSFDLVVGHQFIEHVSSVPATLTELVRVLKPGGLLVLYAPDYRAPHEAHYQIPWPLFPTKIMAEAWVEAFDRPNAGLDLFNYVTAPQVAEVVTVIGCDVVSASIDRPIDTSAIAAFDMSSTKALAESAHRIRAAFQAGKLPAHFCTPTTFAIAGRKR